MKKTLLPILVTVCACVQAFAAGVLVEAERFRDRGGWSVDQQFMDRMGSPYLIAHGLGTPVADAVTTVRFPEAGTYHAYVRTYNWVAPWFDGEGPGRFALKVGGRRLKEVLGTRGDGWMWQYAGKTTLRGGAVEVALVDLSGFDGRCDAVWFTTDADDVPPADVAALDAFRRRASLTTWWSRAAVSRACAPPWRLPVRGAAWRSSTTVRCWAATTVRRFACTWAEPPRWAPIRVWAA